MELDHYIKSGIIESYVLGLASVNEMEELQHMRRLYPSLNAEIIIVERRMERSALAEAILPPPEVKERIFQRLSWTTEETIAPGHDNSASNYTFINIHSKDGQHITVHKWWKLFFILVFILSKICLFFAIYYFLKYQQLEEQRKEIQNVDKQQVIPIK